MMPATKMRGIFSKKVERDLRARWGAVKRSAANAIPAAAGTNIPSRAKY